MNNEIHKDGAAIEINLAKGRGIKWKRKEILFSVSFWLEFGYNPQKKKKNTSGNGKVADQLTFKGDLGLIEYYSIVFHGVSRGGWAHYYICSVK